MVSNGGQNPNDFWRTAEGVCKVQQNKKRLDRSWRCVWHLNEAIILRDLHVLAHFFLWPDDDAEKYSGNARSLEKPTPHKSASATQPRHPPVLTFYIYY